MMQGILEVVRAWIAAVCKLEDGRWERLNWAISLRSADLSREQVTQVLKFNVVWGQKEGSEWLQFGRRVWARSELFVRRGYVVTGRINKS